MPPLLPSREDELRQAYVDGAWAGAFLVALLAGAAFVVLLARGSVAP